MQFDVLSIFESDETEQVDSNDEEEEEDVEEEEIKQGDVKTIHDTTDIHYYVLKRNDKRYTEFIKFIIQTFPEQLNAKSKEGITPLMLVAIHAKRCGTDLVQMLIDAGAFVDLRDQWGWTALMYSVKYCGKTSSVDCVQLLLKSGANPNMYSLDNIWTPLMIACYSKTCLDVAVEILLNYKADPNLVDNDGWHSLFVASCNKNFDTIKLLVERGADIHKCTTNGRNVLMLYMSNDSCTIEEIKFFIEAGIDINSWLELENANVLFFATTSSSVETMKNLILSGVNINAINSNGNTVLAYLLKKISDDIEINDVDEKIKLLLKNDIDVSIVNNDENTAYNLADDNHKILIRDHTMNKFIDKNICQDIICSICLSNFELNVKLKCDHCFHYYCLHKWFKKNTTCPCCRTRIF